MKPDAKKYKNDPARLVKLLEGAGWSWYAAAKQLGIDKSLIGRKLRGETPHRYDFQYVIEELCRYKP